MPAARLAFLVALVAMAAGCSSSPAAPAPSPSPAASAASLAHVLVLHGCDSALATAGLVTDLYDLPPGFTPATYLVGSEPAARQLVLVELRSCASWTLDNATQDGAIGWGAIGVIVQPPASATTDAGIHVFDEQLVTDAAPLAEALRALGFPVASAGVHVARVPTGRTATVDGGVSFGMDVGFVDNGNGTFPAQVESHYTATRLFWQEPTCGTQGVAATLLHAGDSALAKVAGPTGTLRSFDGQSPVCDLGIDLPAT